MDWNLDVRNPRWQLLNASTRISAYTRDSKKIPTAIPMSSGSGNLTELRKIKSDLGMDVKSEMAALIRKYINDILYLMIATKF